MAVLTLSKSRIDKAGQLLSKGEPQTLEDIEKYYDSEILFDEFRQQHL